MSVDMNLLKVDAVGSQRETVWEEKGKGELAKISVSYNAYKIYSLQFLFVENAYFVLSDMYEFLTLVSGTCDDESFGLTSITFGTNKGTYGPYGSKNNSLLLERKKKTEGESGQKTEQKRSKLMQ
ncbi:hypothetical protein CQW23_29552 [Capsicum baccatum]|uniref:Jacalin-type lectin domain-containing protein n=1 Tax=Capsicum baccatum TaxID=33114 RepID=A0A2G2VJQ9_CAPBA|nr:hypothetical protein CQW23_29552 [Capsicum baccatum]